MGDSSVIVTVVPAFAVIAVGYLAARFRLLVDEAARGLSQFVFLFAIPPFLFRTSATVDAGHTSPWAIWGTYFFAATVTWLLAVLVSRRTPSLAPAGGAPAAIASTFGNLVMLGLPLAIGGFGEEAILPAALVISIHAPVHWFAATLLAEWSGRATGRSFPSMAGDLGLSLLRNPIVVALVAGALWSFTGLGLSPVVDRSLLLLGEAGVPTALFALGLSLAAHGLKGQLSGVYVILVLKMALFPALAWLLGVTVFALPPVPLGVVVLFAALPPGANAYIFAEQYRAGVAVVSGSIALGTALAVLTVSLLLLLLA